MTKTVAALYDDIGTVPAVIQDLHEQGISQDQIGLVARDIRGEFEPYLTETVRDEEAVERSAEQEGAEVGLGIGALAGSLIGLLAGSAGLSIPGVGQVLAAGPLAAAVNSLIGASAGAAAGGAAGGLAAALVNMGVEQEQAGYYAEAVRRGGALVTVTAPDELADRAEKVMEDYFPVDIEERVSHWRRRGWRKFNPEAKPLAEEQISKEQGYYKRDIGQGAKAFLDAYETHYQRHLAHTGKSFEEYLPAYQFGYQIATDERFRHERWDQIEPQVRQQWESQEHPGTWDDFKLSIYYGWRKVKELIG
ncbi:MAG: hypothetical protein P8074_06565 [Anaerolineales bacterium]|jgi:hypothetical protein